MSDSQEMTEVIIYTDNFRITGSIALVAGARLTDYIREPGHFFAVANTVVADLHGMELFRSSFLDVNKDHIEIILPAKLIHKSELPVALK